MQDLPFLDLTAPGFSTRGAAVMAARQAHWCARSPFGFAVLHHRQAGKILRDRRFRQGSHDWPRKVGLEGSFAAFWQRSIISQEGDTHRLQRRVAQAALAEDAILNLKPAFRQSAQRLTKGFGDTVEFVSDFAEPFAGQAIATLLALPQDGAAQLARDASTLGLAMGLDAKTHEMAVNAATDRLMALAAQLLADAPPDSFVDRLKGAAAAHGLTDQQALRDLIVIAIFGGVDTTRAQLSFAIALLADDPAHWSRLRAAPEYIPASIAEAIRLRPTTTWATRETCEDVTLDGVMMPAGTTVHVLVHASSTDPATGHNGDFDPFAPRKVHFGFGGGAHHCLGQFVARTDMTCALEVLVSRIARFEWNGQATYLPESGNTSPIRVPVRPIWAAA